MKTLTSCGMIVGTFVATVFLIMSGDGCGAAGHGAAAAPISITLDWRPEPEFGGFYQAQLAGDFARHGVSAVELHNSTGAVPTWKLVATGTTDFATTSADLLVGARAQGADVVALFAVYQTSPQGIMVHKARGFQKIDDVFSSPGALGAESDAWLSYLLARHPSPAVKITSVPKDIGVFLAQKDYSQQCFITSEPLEAARQGGDPQTFLVADAGFNPYVTVLITSGKMLREKPDAVSNVVKAIRDGWRAYLDDPRAANARMHAINDALDERTFAEAAAAQKPFVETEETRQNGLGTMTAARWKALVQQLVDLKVIDKAVPAEECFVNPK